MQKGFAPIIILVGILALALAGGGAYYFFKVKAPVQKACTLEAKICPDGSGVGRSGPNCEFTPCPSSKLTPTNSNDGAGLIRAEAYQGSFESQSVIAPNREVEIIFRLDPKLSLPGTTLNIILPEQIKLLKGDMIWQGNLEPRVPIELKFTVIAEEIGEWEIRAAVKNPKGPAFERVFFAFLVLDKTGGDLKSQPSNKKYPIEQPNKRNN